MVVVVVENRMKVKKRIKHVMMETVTVSRTNQRKINRNRIKRKHHLKELLQTLSTNVKNTNHINLISSG